MLWLTWRQHRVELISALALLAVLATPLIITGLALHAEYHSSGAAACVTGGGDGGCAGLVDAFLERHTEWGNRFVWVSFLPALAGVFIGAPLFAREFEHGTWRLAVTQGVTRTRWLTAKLMLVGTGVAGVAALCAVLFTWWRAPLDEIGGRMHTASFVVAAPSLIAVTLFAFALGVLAGALLRRTIPAMVVTLVTYLIVRITTEESLRPHYRTPLSRTVDPATEGGAGRLPSTDWAVHDGWIDSTGHHLTDAEKTDLLHTIYRGSNNPPDDVVDNYLAAHGMRHYTEYHPDSSFWGFQAIEAALFLGVTAALLVGTAWLVRRRIT
jgi:hypothetical protein